MEALENRFFGHVAAGATWAALTVAAAVPFVFWGKDKAPEFYGSFAAAIVAALAVVLNAFYQAKLAKDRDDTNQRKQKLAEAVDLYFWLDHAIDEMEFISRILGGFEKKLADDNGLALEMPVEQLREVLTAGFMRELPTQAKVAAQLALPIATTVAPILYRTHRTVDRIYMLRGATRADFEVGDIQKYRGITDRRIEKLKYSRTIIAEYLNGSGFNIADTDEI